MTKRSYTFTHAITRTPGQSITRGLRAVDVGAPDHEVFLKHHDDYVAALKTTGATIITLDAMEEFPDSVFVEDAALCLPEVAIAMRPGASSRLGEAAAMIPSLEKLYDTVLTIQGEGFIDGGDILTTEREILIGTSARTDTAGIEELRKMVAPWNYKVRELQTPDGVLHFKTDCSLLDEETILSTKRLDASGCFEGYRVLHTAEGEEACANSIRFNDLVLMPDGFPKTEELLVKEGYNIRKIGNSEAAKLDGGMSCLSLRFSPPMM
ncbi:N(G),N(G)-dimethylarginine dimethylaminohydrolase [Pseudovibrio sp. Ad46]|uniref:dimethylarginine dimethylaminohydrolase family protein n=1 Tax=Pseudovibrio sp. Ad46 TaxID=989432 RepID=UPI0007AE3F70|nr:dimethylarginine dimethylaminohydrolase [Pseudovibrio sp. Ad46]KZK88585.1 N(G),N(G)-dimethylarginine dimethylaminohydrolase [Pseudovibrio sp. Ad46]